MSNHDLIPTEGDPVIRERRKILPFFNFLLILVLGSGAGILWWWVEPQIVWNDDLTDIQVDIRTLRDQVDDLSNRQIRLPTELIDGVTEDLTTLIELNANSIREQQQHIDELEARLESSAARVENALNLSSNPENDVLERSHSDHLIFLLRLARNQLHLWNDPKSALRSLEEVDSVLEESNNAVFDSTRSEVLAHIQRLRELAAIDITGALLRLNVLADRVGGIAFNATVPSIETAITQSESELASEEGSEESSIWRSLINRAIGLVKVTTHEQLDVQPLLNSEEQRLVQLRMILNLEKASQAVLRSNQSLYDTSLDTVIGMVNRHLKTEDSSVTTFLTEIVELRAIQVEVDLPDLDQTIQNLPIASNSRPQVGESKLEVETIKPRAEESSN